MINLLRTLVYLVYSSVACLELLSNEKWHIKRLLSKGSESCSETEFECSLGDCIPKNWLCDFHRDCTDGMDEKNCGSKLSISPKVDCWNQQGTKEKKNEKKKKLRNTHDKEELFTLEEKKERESWNSVLKS